VRLLLGPGQRHDATRSHELIAGFEPDAVIADKGYDAGHLHQAIYDTGRMLSSRLSRTAKRHGTMTRPCIRNATSSNASSTR